MSFEILTHPSLPNLRKIAREHVMQNSKEIVIDPMHSNDMNGYEFR